MGGACSMYGREVKCVQDAGKKTEDHFEDLSVDMGIILRWIFNEEDRRPWTELI
jgi:hypothetical protein